MHPIEQEFLAKATVRGGILLLKLGDALAMVQRCRELGVRVLGVDGFRLTERTTQPIMEHSIDTSGLRGDLDAWTRVERFLSTRAEDDLCFEVVIPEG